MSPKVSQDSGESLMQKAMLMTSLAIQKEKEKKMKTPQKSEKVCQLWNLSLKVKVKWFIDAYVVYIY